MSRPHNPDSPAKRRQERELLEWLRDRLPEGATAIRLNRKSLIFTCDGERFIVRAERKPRSL